MHTELCTRTDPLSLRGALLQCNSNVRLILSRLGKGALGEQEL